MCTVTFVRSQNKYIITSNRDEQTSRPASFKPELYDINSKNIYFPKDPKAGGTWFAVAENSNVAVLLNGAFARHQFGETYKKSRGLILLDIISANSPTLSWNEIDLDNIEPFTIILLEQDQLYQLRWDGIVKHTLNLDAGKNYIWSSVTLYSDEIIASRKKWFDEFQQRAELPDEFQMRQFHMHTSGDDPMNGLVMDRDGVVKTQSITQAVIEKNKVDLYYHDLLSEKDYSNAFLIL